LNIDSLDKFFDPVLRSGIRAMRNSGDDWVRELCAGMDQTAEILSASDADIEDKLSTERAAIILGRANCDFLPTSLAVGLSSEVLTGGILVVGSVRSGKSNLVTSVCDQAEAGGMTAWTITRKKEHLHRARNPSTLLVVPGRFPHNPLRPPRYATNWIAQWCEVLSATMDLGGVSSSFLARAIADTMERFSRLHPDLKYATLFQVRTRFTDFKKNIPTRDRPKIEYATRAEDRIDGLQGSPVGQDYIVYDGPNLDDLLFRNVVFDISELSVREAAYCVNFWLTYRLVALMSSHHLVPKADHVVTIDEGEDILLRGPGVSNLSLVSRYFNLFRELGTSLMVSSHSFEALRSLPFLLNNTAALVMLPMSSRTEMSSMGRVMGIDSLDLDPTELELGEGIAKLAGVNRAIRIAIDKVQVDRVVTRKEMNEFERRTNQFLAGYDIHYVPVEERIFIFDEMAQQASGEHTAKEVIKEKNERLDERLREFVSVVADNSGISLKETKSLLSFGSSNTTVDAVKKIAVERKYIKEVKRYFDKGETGRPMSRMGATADGFRFANKSSVGLGKGDIQQIFLPHVRKHFVTQALTELKGESFVNRSDLYVYRNGILELAIELSVTTPIDHILNQIQSVLDEAPAILVIVIGLAEESDGVYVASKQREENKAATLWKRVSDAWNSDPRIIVKTWEQFRQEVNQL